MKLTSRELKDFFVGTLLGDSYLRNGAFMCKQVSKDLIEFKAKIVEEHIPGCEVRIKEHTAYIDKNGVSHQKYYQLTTRKHPYFIKLWKEFYVDGTKTIPNKYLRGLSPLGYAMWYADDGTTVLVGINDNGSAKNRRVDFCTDGFTIPEVENLQKMVAKQYGKTSLVKRNNTRRIRIGAYDAQQFLLNISPYFIDYFPSLIYKLDMGYRNESLDRTRYVNPEYKKLFLKISAHSSFVDRLEGR